MKNKTIIIMLAMMIILVSSVLAIGTAPDNEDILAFYTFDDDETSGSTLYDLTDNDNDGTIDGATTGVAGVLNEQYSFNSDKVSISDSNDFLSGLTSLWVCGWFKGTIVQDYSSYINNWGNSNQNLVFLTHYADVQFSLYMTNGQNAGGGAFYSLPASTTKHLCFYWDGTADVDLYVDGVFEATKTGTLSGTGTLRTNTHDLWIGEQDGFSRAINGQIDELVFGTGTFTSDTALFFYQGGSPTEAQQYPFAEETESFDITNTNGINNMTAYFNSTSYSTTNGTINTGIESSESFTIIMEANEGYYFNSTYTDHDLSEDLEVTFNLYPRVTINNDQGVNNFTLYLDSGTYSTTNGTINTVMLDGDYYQDITLESNEGYYFNNTYNNYNVNNTLTFNFTEYPRVTIYNEWNTTSLTNFNISYDTTTINDIEGVAYIPLNESKEITINKENYIQKIIEHDFTNQNDLNTSIYQSIINISLREEISNNTISNWELYQDSTKIAESTSDSVIKYMNAGEYTNLTIKSKDASFSDRAVNNITINTLDNKTEYIYIFLSDLNITAINSMTSNPISNFTINISSYNHTDTRDFTTTTGNLIIPVTSNDTYNIIIDAQGYALYAHTENITINESPRNVQFSLYTNNSISFTIRDETTSELITELIFITLTGDNISYSTNTSTGTQYLDSIRDGVYSIKIWNADYDPKYYDVTVAERSHQNLDAYLSTNYEDCVFTFLDKTSHQAIEGVLFVQSRVINGSWAVVASKNSDITGRIPTSYVPDTAYRISLSKSGYVSKTFTLDPFLFDTYTVQLTRSSSTQSTESDVSVIFEPLTFYEGNNTLTLTFFSPLGNLNSYWVNITYPNNTSFVNGNNSIGEAFEIPFNITDPEVFDKLTITYHYETVQGTQKTAIFPFSIIPVGAWYGTFAQNKLETYGLGLFERILIVVGVTIILAGLVFTIAGLGGSLLIMILVFGFAQIIGFIPLWSIVITALIGFILIIKGASRWHQQAI